MFRLCASKTAGVLCKQTFPPQHPSNPFPDGIQKINVYQINIFNSLYKYISVIR